MTDAIQLSGPSDVQRANHLKQQVDADGMARFRVASRQEFLELSTGFGELFVHRDADPDAITVVKHDPERAGLDGYAALTAGPLKPHTDGSGNRIVPKYVALWCFRNEGVGGECAMADGQAVIKDLLTENPWVVDRLSSQNAAVFKSGTEQYDGPVVWNDGEHWRIRLRIDSNGFFSAEALHAVAILREAIAARTFTFPLEAGDGYVIDNQRYIHGRLTFNGTREMLRTLMI
jgi:alpha-ketoglutarate-dependent taurine dioxygenase